MDAENVEEVVVYVEGEEEVAAASCCDVAGEQADESGGFVEMEAAGYVAYYGDAEDGALAAVNVGGGAVDDAGGVADSDDAGGVAVADSGDGETSCAGGAKIGQVVGSAGGEGEGVVAGYGDVAAAVVGGDEVAGCGDEPQYDAAASGTGQNRHHCWNFRRQQHEEGC